MNILRMTVVLGAGLAAFGTQAAEWEERHQMQVSYAGLDLKTTAGSEVLYRRIRAAANSVCSSLDGKEPGARYRFKQCVSAAISRAVTDVDAPALTAYYAAEIGKREQPVALAAER
jgi:UrcA family protein